MHKLKLETLQVESFDTTDTGSRLRGTVEGHADINSRGCPGGTGPSFCALCHHTEPVGCEPDTYDVRTCGDTQYFDCTFGCTVECTQQNSCDVCW